MSIEAVVFDLDGTLLDRRATFRRHLELQVERHPSVFAAADPDMYVARLLTLDENGSLDRAGFHRLAETELRLPAGSSLLLHEDFQRHFPEACVPLPNVHDTLSALRAAGIKLGLITNGGRIVQARKIEGLGLRVHLDVVLISEEVGVRKPDRRIFTMALDALGVDAGSAAYVGDDPEADVRGARASGLLAIWRRDRFWEEPPEADCVIDDLCELPGVLERTGR